MNFQETGNKIPVTAQELIDYVQQLLEKHDTDISTNKVLPNFNPYTNPIIYNTNDGKTIKIPEEIQKQAIDLWYQKNGTNVAVMQQVQPQQIYNQYTEQTVDENKNRENTDYFTLFILIIGLVFALYLLYNMNNKN